MCCSAGMMTNIDEQAYWSMCLLEVDRGERKDCLD